MRSSNPTTGRRKAPIRTALIALLVALVGLAATSAAYAVGFIAPSPDAGSTLDDATYGDLYGPINFAAEGTNASSIFFIDTNPPPNDPPFDTSLPAGLVLNTTTGQSTASISGTPTAPAGTYRFVVGVSGVEDIPNGSGVFAYRGYALTIRPAPLTVTVNNLSRAYGAANPQLTYTVSGLRNGDTAAQVLQGALATTANASSPVGNYNITQGTLALTAYGTARYTLTFNQGTLSVTPAPLTVRANDATRRVGAPNPAFSVSYNGFVNSEDESVLGGTLQITTPADTTSPAGTYPIIPSGLTSTNYAITFENGTLTVTNQDVPQISWPTPAAITYGTPLSASQLNATASFNDQPVAGTFTYTPAAGTVLAAGTQNLQVLFTPADTVNFAPVPANTTITVNRAPLTVTANNATRRVGEPNPAFSATFSGFVNNEGPSVLGGTLSFTTSATATSPAGTYSIVPSGLTSNNYTITYVNGTLTVTDFQLYLPLLRR